MIIITSHSVSISRNIFVMNGNASLLLRFLVNGSNGYDR